MVGEVKFATIYFANRVIITLKDQFGNVKGVRDIYNSLTQDGCNQLASCLGRGSTGAIWLVALGTESLAGGGMSQRTSITDEISDGGGAVWRQNATYTRTAGVSSPSWTQSIQFGPHSTAASFALQNAGIYAGSVASAGIMFAMASYGTLTKKSTDTITVQWAFSVTQA